MTELQLSYSIYHDTHIKHRDEELDSLENHRRAHKAARKRLAAGKPMIKVVYPDREEQR